MSQVCEKCGKRPFTGNQISHSHRKTVRWFRPNLFIKKVIDPKTGISKKTKICSKCLKTLSKQYVEVKLPKKKTVSEK